MLSHSLTSCTCSHVPVQVAYFDTSKRERHRLATLSEAYLQHVSQQPAAAAPSVALIQHDVAPLVHPRTWLYQFGLLATRASMAYRRQPMVLLIRVAQNGEMMQRDTAHVMDATCCIRAHVHVCVSLTPSVPLPLRGSPVPAHGYQSASHHLTHRIPLLHALHTELRHHRQ